MRVRNVMLAVTGALLVAGRAYDDYDYGWDDGYYHRHHHRDGGDDDYYWGADYGH